MNDVLQAFIEFLTDLFAALAKFLGGSFDLGEIIDGTTTTVPAEESTTAAPTV